MQPTQKTELQYQIIYLYLYRYIFYFILLFYFFSIFSYEQMPIHCPYLQALIFQALRKCVT